MAVVGAVSRPGLVSQTVRNSTILDAISAVGGLTAQAGSRIYLIPAENRGRPESQGAELAMRAMAFHRHRERPCSGRELIEAIAHDPHLDLLELAACASVASLAAFTTALLQRPTAPFHSGRLQISDREPAHLLRAAVLRLETKPSLDRPRLLCLGQRLQSLRRVSVLGFHGRRLQFRSG